MTHEIIMITGLSGAGISSVLKALEDFDYEVFDNFPVPLVPSLIKNTSSAKGEQKRIAIGIDARTRGFTPEALLKLVEDVGARFLYITCDDATLQKRFTETRRRHPLAKEKSLMHGIKNERELLRPLKNKADIVIDSSDISVHDLRHILEGHFLPCGRDHVTITLMSFGFRNGVPREADIVMDVRFLRNPHWDKNLKCQTGLDAPVGKYIGEDESFEPFLQNFKTMLEPLLPRYALEGKSYLTIAVGCTGGKHRSVYTVERIKIWLEQKKMHVYTEHRDIYEDA